MSEGTEDLTLYRRIFDKSVFVSAVFDCIFFFAEYTDELRKRAL